MRPAPGLFGASCHDAFAEHDVRQYLANLACGERGGCVQFILLSSHRLLVAKLRYEVASTGWSILRANEARLASQTRKLLTPATSAPQVSC